MREDARLPTHVWVTALVRQWNGEGYPAVMRRRGDQIGGSVIIVVDRCNASSILLGERRDIHGRREWMALGSGTALTSEEEAHYLEKAVSQDRDIWVVGVECAEGWPPLNAPLEPALANL